MNRASLSLILAFGMLIVPALPATAQVSFFQAPIFGGCCTLFVGDFNGDGKLDILASDTSGGYLNLGNGDGTFKAPGLQISGQPLAVADFNGDGTRDILEQTTGELQVLLGKGDGTFQAPISTASGASLTVVAAADVNGDGKVDVVAVSGSTLLVYLGKGDGTFGSPLSSNLGGSASLSTLLSFADFNGDGKVDIAISNVSTSGTGILIGNGDGTFQAAVFPANLTTFNTQFTADLNNDGKADLVASSGQVALGNGDGTFTVLAAPTLSCLSCIAAAIADVNGDGKPDLITMTNTAASGYLFTQIYLGNGDGTFTYAHSYAPQLVIPGSGVTSFLAVGDFNSDGKPDIAYSGAILLGNGDGTFEGIPLGIMPNGLAGSIAVTGDFANNNRVDVAMACGSGSNTYTSVCIFSNDGRGNLTLTDMYTALQQTYVLRIVTADFNGDGKPDLFVLGADATSDLNYSVLLGNGDGSFQSPVVYALSTTVANNGGVIVADFNHDGKLDVGTTISGQFAVLLGNGDGTFAAPVYYFDGGYSSLMAADFNGDGKLDVAVGNTSGVGTAFLFGNGDGTFQTAVFPANLNNFAAAFTGDLNNDGKADLVSANQVALGNGDGTFNILPAMPCPSGTSCGVYALADINGDGILDVLVSEVFSRLGISLDLRLGNGDGTFGSDIPVQTNGQIPLVADMNGDGQPDLVFPDFPGVYELFNTTAPGFSLGPAPGSPTSQTITAGQTSSFSLVVTPTGKFSGTVNLSCAITPAVTPAPTCSLSNSSVQISGSGSQPVTVTVGTTAPVTAGTTSYLDIPLGPMPIGWTAILFGSGWLCVRSRKRLQLISAPVIVFALASLMSCGGSNSASSHTMTGTPAGTYLITITATSPNLNRTTTLQVVVQ